MQDVFRERLANYGQWTYRGAWALEITAALLGLTTGIALGYQAFSNSDGGSVTSIDLTLASAPFIMVAIAELTKIPIATLLFSARWVWKPLIFVFLVALAGITFETVFMGLERASTLRQLRYEDVASQIKKLSSERDGLSRNIADAGGTDQLRKAKDGFDLILAQEDQERAKTADQVREVEKDLEGQRVIVPGVARVRDALREKTEQRDRLVAERDTVIREAVGQFERQRESFVERSKNARQSGDNDAGRRFEEEAARLQNPRRRLEQQYAPRVSALDTEIVQARAEFDRLLANAPPMSPAERQQLETRRDDLRRRLDAIAVEWEGRRASARRQLEDAQAEESRKLANAASDQRSLADVTTKISALEKQRVEFARTDQIRRIAARFYGVRPEEVTEDQAGLVSVLWFGSLAVLAALAGPLTAIVALSLQRIAAGASLMERETKLARLMRRMLLSWRWKRVRSMPVRVEVPVEKEVERRVEVPVEKVVKEILYVPVLTDDPEAVRRALSDNLPREIADLVSISVGRKRDGSPSQHQPA